MSDNGLVYVNFTIGFGNNMFQYCFARILSEIHGLPLFHPAMPAMNIPEKNIPKIPWLPKIIVNDSNYRTVLSTKLEPCILVVNGYFEDYEIIEPYLDRIRNWFPKVPITNTKDVILHLRLQNRLIHESHNKNHITASSIKEVLGCFDYNRLHIVTDAKK